MNYVCYLNYRTNSFPSVARPSLTFLGSLPNSGYKESIFFHCSESTACRNNPSHFLPLECHLKFFASLTFPKNRFKRGIIGRYHNTLAGGPFFMSSSSFTLYLDTLHLGHLCNPSNSFLYNIQSERNCFGWNTGGGWIGFQNLFQKLVDLLRNSKLFNKLDLYWLYWARQ